MSKAEKESRIPIDPQIVQKLHAHGWSKSGARFLASHANDPSLARLLRKTDCPQPRVRPSKPPSNKQPIPSDLRWRVWERDNFTCLHCGSRRDLTADHFVPESRGGLMTFENLQTLCRTCNCRKGARMPDQGDA
jgi:5-methylcytosine-specific restriction endonuclease McrA